MTRYVECTNCGADIPDGAQCIYLELAFCDGDCACEWVDEQANAEQERSNKWYK